MKIIASIVNAFTTEANGGNPAGVVLNSPKLTDKQMSLVTKNLKVSETAFVFPGKLSDYKVRFFSPTMEVDLCGHATIATFFYMAQEGKIVDNKNKILTQETKAGILPISIEFNGQGVVERVMMKQASPQIKDIHLDILSISRALNVKIEDINQDLPQQIVSTGLFTLPICIKSLQLLKNIKPDFEKVKNLCIDLGVGSIHCFTFETIEPKSVYHARNFGPIYGINEDPVTGTVKTVGRAAEGTVKTAVSPVKALGEGKPDKMVTDPIEKGGKTVYKATENTGKALTSQKVD